MRETKEHWSNVKRPMGVARLDAHRLGWSFQGPFVLLTDQGVRLALTEVAPSRIADEAVLAFERRQEALLARSWQCTVQDRQVSGTDVRLAAEPIRRILRSTMYSAKTDRVCPTPSEN